MGALISGVIFMVLGSGVFGVMKLVGFNNQDLIHIENALEEMKYDTRRAQIMKRRLGLLVIVVVLMLIGLSTLVISSLHMFYGFLGSL